MCSMNKNSKTLVALHFREKTLGPFGIRMVCSHLKNLSDKFQGEELFLPPPPTLTLWHTAKKCVHTSRCHRECTSLPLTLLSVGRRLAGVRILKSKGSCLVLQPLFPWVFSSHLSHLSGACLLWSPPASNVSGESSARGKHESNRTLPSRVLPVAKPYQEIEEMLQV